MLYDRIAKVCKMFFVENWFRKAFGKPELSADYCAGSYGAAFLFVPLLLLFLGLVFAVVFQTTFFFNWPIIIFGGIAMAFGAWLYKKSRGRSELRRM